MTMTRSFVALIAFLLSIFLLDAGVLTGPAEARSFKGGRLFKQSAPAYRAPAQKQQPATTQQKGGFGRGLAGGLLGGAIGGLLFGSLFGMGGQGMGLLPILLLAGAAFFLYRSFARRQQTASVGYRPPPHQGFETGGYDPLFERQPGPEPAPVAGLENGLAQIRRTDPGFDEKYFVEIASDVFFQVQAGWMRRDISTYRHLLGEQLAAEYEIHFKEMKARGHINKLENIAIRTIELTDAGSDGREDFVTVLFQANLLDYTVSDVNGELVDGSMTEPVKFAEKWSWARPVGTEDWRLEGIDIVNG